MKLKIKIKIEERDNMYLLTMDHKGEPGQKGVRYVQEVPTDQHLAWAVGEYILTQVLFQQERGENKGNPQ